MGSGKDVTDSQFVPIVTGGKGGLRRRHAMQSIVSEEFPSGIIIWSMLINPNLRRRASRFFYALAIGNSELFDDALFH